METEPPNFSGAFDHLKKLLMARYTGVVVSRGCTFGGGSAFGD